MKEINSSRIRYCIASEETKNQEKRVAAARLLDMVILLVGNGSVFEAAFILFNRNKNRVYSLLYYLLVTFSPKK